MVGNRIARSRIVDGLVTPAFIHNDGYCFINLQVYADGLVNCWEMVDLALFEEKLRSGWVTAGVPDGEGIHVHDLGAWTIEAGRWPLKAQDLHQRVTELVRQLNPRMENLHDCHGRTIEKIGGVNVFILGVPDARPVRVAEAGPFAKRIKGESTSVFVRDGERWWLADLRAFADGVIELGRLPAPELLDLSELKRAVKQGRVASSLVPGTSVEIDQLGSFIVRAERWSADIQEILRSVPDLIDHANGRPGSVKRCIAAYDAYRKDPTETLREALRIAYDAVPEHRRRYVGDMDTKDIAVRMILYGEQEIEHWSHRIVARQRGDKLPTITVPEPRTEKKPKAEKRPKKRKTGKKR